MTTAQADSAEIASTGRVPQPHAPDRGVEVRGGALLKPVHRLLIRIKNFGGRALPEEFNPLTQSGAIANVSFIIALITGILVLFWYVPSVSQAYGSVEAMRDSPYLAQLLRSLHRYSSDVCMLFAVIHAIQIFFARRFDGQRWLAWVTGVILIGLVWFDGWTGYWLVWDDRGAQVAIASARFLDTLPIFSAPLSMTFMTDKSVSNLLFFIVFFVHMLIPIGFGVAIWLHISRVSRSKFLTSWPMAAVVMVSLVAMSFLVPAYSSKPANMLELVQGYSIDWYYMLPLYVTDRLSGGAQWGLMFVATLVVMGVPWYMVKRRKELVKKSAVIVEDKCNGCQTCFADCPFTAISMAPREGKFPLVARIDPNKCVQCGVCVGSCDSAGTLLPEYPSLEVRSLVNRWLPKEAEKNGDEFLAFVCRESAAGGLKPNPLTGRTEDLPGYRVVEVPCVSWVHPLLIERGARRGAKGVLLVGCGSDPSCREGVQWMHERIEGKRRPELRMEKMGTMPVRLLERDLVERKTFMLEAEEFRKNPDQPKVDRSSPASRWGGVVVVAAALFVLGFGLTRIPYSPPVTSDSELAVTLQHLGKVKAQKADPKLKGKIPEHLRGKVHTGRIVRAPVRLRITIDGKVVHNKAYRPAGLFKGGASIAMVQLPVTPGTHNLVIEVGESADLNEWRFRSSRKVEFKKGYRRAVLFKAGGFEWH